MSVGNVTLSSSYLRALRALTKTKENIDNISMGLSTGKKIHRPSDSPLDWNRIFRLRNKMINYTQYRRNIEVGRSQLAMTENSLQTMEHSVNRLKELALQASSGIVNARDRLTIADEIKSIREQFVELGNTKFEGKFIFGGYRTDVTPFTMTPQDANGLASVSYNGDNGEIKVLISDRTLDSFIDKEFNAAPVALPGTLTPIGAGEIVINGIPMNAAVSDNLSYTDSTASAIAVVTAVNENSDVTGVLASVAPNRIVGDTAVNIPLGGVNFTANAAGTDANTFKINGVNIVGQINNITDLVNAVNEQTGEHGVVAKTQGESLVLIASDGRNVTIEGNGAANTALGIAGFSAERVYRAGVRLHSYANVDMSQNIPGTGAGVTLATGDFILNGVDVTGAATDLNTLIATINGFSGQTGVRAMVDPATGTQMVLVDSLGRDMMVQCSAAGSAVTGYEEGTIQHRAENSTGLVVSDTNLAVDLVTPRLGSINGLSATGTFTDIRGLSATEVVNTDGETLFTGVGLASGVNIFDVCNDFIRGLKGMKALNMETTKDFNELGLPMPLQLTNNPAQNDYDLKINGIPIYDGATAVGGANAINNIDDLISLINTSLTNAGQTSIKATANHDNTRVVLIGPPETKVNIEGKASATQFGFVAGSQYGQANQLGDAMQNLDTFLGQVIQVRGQLGARMNKLEKLDGDMQYDETTHKQSISNLEDADMIELASMLSQQQTLFQTILQATSRTLGSSLLDFLR